MKIRFLRCMCYNTLIQRLKMIFRISTTFKFRGNPHVMSLLSCRRRGHEFETRLRYVRMLWLVDGLPASLKTGSYHLARND